MKGPTYYAPTGGLPPQTQLLTGRAVFTEAYAVVPRGVYSDIVTSFLPFWDKTRLWVIARPLSGFAETFSQYIVEVSPGGGSDKPELDPDAEGVLFVVEGELSVTLDGKAKVLTPGGYAYIPPSSNWRVRNQTGGATRFHWIRKSYERVEGIAAPDAIFANDGDVAPGPMPDTEGKWATTRFVDPADLRHDMHVTIVTLKPGAVIPFAETHVMEHGSTSSKARPSIASTRIGSRSRPATSCGCAPSARKPVMPAAPATSAICCTRMSTGT